MKQLFSVFLLCAALSAGAASAQSRFSGEPEFKYLDKDHITLLSEFTYTDNHKYVWRVPKGTVSDGASIPRIVWSLIGHPFSGDTIKAALVHDFYCDVRLRDRKSVNRVFFEALIDSKVGEIKAKTMYAAVNLGAPHWNNQAVRNTQIIVSLAQRDQPACDPSVPGSCKPKKILYLTNNDPDSINAFNELIKSNQDVFDTMEVQSSYSDEEILSIVERKINLGRLETLDSIDNEIDVLLKAENKISTEYNRELLLLEIMEFRNKFARQTGPKSEGLKSIDSLIQANEQFLDYLLRKNAEAQAIER